MANNLALVASGDQFGGTGGWVLSITDQTGSGLTDSFSATGLGYMNLVLVDSGTERLSMTGAAEFALKDTSKESLAFTMTGEFTGDLALTESASEYLRFTMPDHDIPMELALYETLPEILTMTGKSDIGNALALLDWPSEEFEGTASTISDTALRHVRDNV